MPLFSTTPYTTDHPQDAHFKQRVHKLAKQSEAGSAFTPSLLQPVRCWLSEIEISDRNQARMFCVLIPAHCPFERKFTFFGRTILSIPPLCKLNPFYEELVALRFRSLCYLVEVVGDDISRFC